MPARSRVLTQINFGLLALMMGPTLILTACVSTCFKCPTTDSTQPAVRNESRSSVRARLTFAERVVLYDPNEMSFEDFKTDQGSVGPMAVFMAPSTSLRSRDRIFLGGCLRMAHGPLTTRSLLLTSHDQGQTWQEIAIAISGSCIEDLRSSPEGILSAIVFWNNGDGAFRGLLVSRDNGGSWQFVRVPDTFDAQKWLGAGSYGFLSHRWLDAEHSSLVTLVGAERTAQIKMAAPKGKKEPEVVGKVRFLRFGAESSKTPPSPDPIQAAETLWREAGLPGGDGAKDAIFFDPSSGKISFANPSQ